MEGEGAHTGLFIMNVEPRDSGSDILGRGNNFCEMQGQEDGRSIKSKMLFLGLVSKMGEALIQYLKLDSVALESF